VESDYYCVFFHFIDSRFENSPFVSMIQPPYAREEMKFVTVDDDGDLNFHFNDSLFEAWYKKIRES
jgi:hypothetical protein